MNKVILTAIFLFIMANAVFAGGVVQRITYSNGVVIFLCDIKGKVDYCTDHDRQKAEEMQKNPYVSVIEQITIEQNPDDNDFNQKCRKTQGQIQSGTNLLYSVIDLARVTKGLFGVKW